MQVPALLIDILEGFDAVLDGWHGEPAFLNLHLNRFYHIEGTSKLGLAHEGVLVLSIAPRTAVKLTIDVGLQRG